MALTPPPRNRRRFVVRHDERPFTMNQTRQWSWHVHRRVIADWRADWKILGLSVPLPRMECVRIYATPIRRRRAGRGQDVGACMPAVKAAIDGLIDMGMCVDDNDSHVVEIRMMPGRLGKLDGLELVIEEV